jgi:hypothetical protein
VITITTTITITILVVVVVLKVRIMVVVMIIMTTMMMTLIHHNIHMNFPGEFNFGAYWTTVTPTFYRGCIELYQISQKLFILQMISV